MTTPQTPRFVVLRHEFGPGENGRDHWDLMFQRSDVLATWRIDDSWPLMAVSHAEKIQDHRLEYLEYEGPVSGGRGSVRRVDWGTYATVLDTSSHLVFDIAGASLRGRLTLRRREPKPNEVPSLSEDQWDASLEADEKGVDSSTSA